MTTFGRTLSGLLLVAVAGVAGFTAYRSAGDRHASQGGAAGVRSERPSPGSGLEAATAAPEGGASAPASPPPIPQQLPEFFLTDRDGVRRSLSHWHDQPLMVNFWATWCVPCRREIPLLRQLRAAHRADRLEVIGVAVDFREAVLEFARKIGIDYPLLIGEQDAMDAATSLGVDMVFPFTVFADRRHRIVAVKIGELHADEAGFILDRVRDIDANRLELEAARPLIADRLRELAVARAQKTTK